MSWGVGDLESHIKGTIITLVWLAGFTGAIWPLGLNSKPETLSFLSCFSAGVILSVALLHLLPDAEGELQLTTDYPLGNLLCCLGLFIVLFVEKVIMGPHEAVIGDWHGHGGHATAERPLESDQDPILAKQPEKVRHALHPTEALDSTCTYTPGCEDLKSPMDTGGLALPAWDTTLSKRTVCNAPVEHHHHLAYQSKQFRQGLESGINFAKHMNNEVNTDVQYDERSPSRWVPLTLLFLLSFHSILEGLALGSAQTDRDIFVLAVAILSHKFLAAMSLGISFVKSNIPSHTHATYAVFFSSMTPFGALLGVFVSEILDDKFVRLFAATMQALGSGSFVYIALMEFIPEELVGEQSGWKLFVCFIGFAAMALVALYV
ncbi:Protein zntC [Diplonema papillatum]|nr:Protein zntC [Diplonema papillatum]|eukprot:gene9073-14048_t